MANSIAIDGPAGAGKSTIAKIVSKKLGFIYVDTGAMFRAMAICCLDAGVNIDEEEAVSSLCKDIDIDIEYKDGVQQVITNGKNVTGRLRDEATGNAASVIAPYRKVREILKQLQRSLAKVRNVVMDGRDIGTCVLPDATCKIYLTASVAVRAQRRAKELAEKGIEVDMAKIEADIKDRDYRDMHRNIAPLKKADDAAEVDSSDMTIDEVVDAIIERYNEARAVKE